MPTNPLGAGEGTDPPGVPAPRQPPEPPAPARTAEDRHAAAPDPPTPTPPSPPATAVAHVRDDAYWAKPVARLHLAQVPAGAAGLNIEGRRVSGAVQGFGQLWQRTYRVKLEGVQASPAEVVAAWKHHLPEYQPPANRFFPTVAGVEPGEIVLIDATVSGLPVSTGVMVVYADDESFTLMTPQGHPESGWITFSAFQEGDATVAQVQSIARAFDPVMEVGFRFLGGVSAQRQIWVHVLTSLAAHHGATQAAVEVHSTCVDPRLQWSRAGNVWQNAILRSVLALPRRLLKRPASGG